MTSKHRIACRVTTAILALVMRSGGAADVPAGRALAPAGVADPERLDELERGVLPI